MVMKLQNDSPLNCCLSVVKWMNYWHLSMDCCKADRTSSGMTCSGMHSAQRLSYVLFQVTLITPTTQSVCFFHFVACNVLKQEAQLSQRGRAMPRVIEYLCQSLKAALIRRINTVTFANVGSVSLPSLKFVGLRVRKIFLRTRAFIFCLPRGRPCGNHAKRCINEKTIQCLPNPSQHVPIYI